MGVANGWIGYIVFSSSLMDSELCILGYMTEFILAIYAGVLHIWHYISNMNVGNLVSLWSTARVHVGR
jgi:hypothetical protein